MEAKVSWRRRGRWIDRGVNALLVSWYYYWAIWGRLTKIFDEVVLVSEKGGGGGWCKFNICICMYIYVWVLDSRGGERKRMHSPATGLLGRMRSDLGYCVCECVCREQPEARSPCSSSRYRVTWKEGEADIKSPLSVSPPSKSCAERSEISARERNAHLSIKERRSEISAPSREGMRLIGRNRFRKGGVREKFGEATRDWQKQGKQDK